MSTAQSPELQSQISQWRAAAIAGTLTIDQMREAIKALRSDRYKALEASRASKSSKPKAPAKSADDMLKELGL